MAFSDFKSVADVQAQFQIKYVEAEFIEIQDFQLRATFLEEFEFNQQNLDVFSSEGARCEMVIFPILREVYKDYHQSYALWVQKALNYDAVLCGTPDYIVSKRSELGKTVLGTPLLVVVEAKRNDFEQGWGQCLAELVAMQKINEAIDRPVYGIVTDGKLWEFGQLVGDRFFKNRPSYTIDQLSPLFGALQFVFAQAGQWSRSMPMPSES